VKGWILVFVMMWVCWTLPRLRIDQVMMTCLRYLLPISCVLLLGVSVWQLLLNDAPILGYCRYVLAAATVLAILLVCLRIFRSTGPTPTQLMPGAWAAAGKPQYQEAEAGT